MPVASKAWAFFKRDLRTDLSYKISFVFQAADVVLGCGAFFFLARVLGRGAFRGYEPFAFILVGIAVNGYMTTCLACFTQAIRGNQPLGTLKAVLVTPTSAVSFVLFSSLYPFVRAALDALLYLVAGTMLGLSLSPRELSRGALDLSSVCRSLQQHRNSFRHLHAGFQARATRFCGFLAACRGCWGASITPSRCCRVSCGTRPNSCPSPTPWWPCGERCCAMHRSPNCCLRLASWRVLRCWECP